MTSRLLDTLGTTDAFADVFSDRSLLAAMLHSKSRWRGPRRGSGVIPPQAADVIADAADPDAFDARRHRRRGARRPGTIAIGFVAGTHRSGPGAGCDERRIRALGRDEPGRH